MFRYFSFFTLIFLVSGCTQQSKEITTDANFPILERVPSSESNVKFANKLSETKYINAVTVDAFLSGTGIGILDVNNDGRPDIYMGGNQVADKLYLNRGNFKFEDISLKAGIGNETTWTTGISIADVNSDGLDDIYVCKSLDDNPQKRANLLYINQGDNRFEEQSVKYGLADQGHSMIGNFFDYDRDGDLDLYICNQPPSSMIERQKLKGKKDFTYTDQLYRNDGEKFTLVTEEAGVKNYSYTLSTTVLDINQDGWPDLYVACDYEEPDQVFINQKNGKFINKADDMLRHMSNFSMGTDIVDLNHDGLMDVFTADMVAEDNFRSKTLMSGMNPAKFWALANNGYHFQYMFNSMQLNNGNGTFSEIAQMAGISNSDWSWAPLFVDFDQDGHKDLFVTNGMQKEMRNKDYEKKRGIYIAAEQAKGRDNWDILYEVSQMAPSTKLLNYLFQNNGDLTFTKRSVSWGITDPTWSQGAAYADFDGDGDMDLVVSNVNEEAYIYRNTANENNLNHYLTVELQGPKSNPRGFQSKIELKIGDDILYDEMTPYRGFLATCQPICHFGLGKNTTVDRLKITWPDGKVSTLTNVNADKKIKISYKGAQAKPSEMTLLVSHFKKENNTIYHKENVYDDYQREILIPHKMSTLGPDITSADLDGDGLDEVYLAGSAGEAGQLLHQNSDGTFTPISVQTFAADRIHEDASATFFDADQDKDLDLYVVSGGNEFPIGSAIYQDRLYLNDGKGNFTKSNLPRISSSGSIATPLDFDEDGDLDLFIGGRQVPGKYGRHASSILLENQSGKFQDVTTTKAPDFLEMGMVADAVWVDLDGKPQNELAVVGEWMPIQIYRFEQGVFSRLQNFEKLDHTSGWWNSITSADIDNDGDQDLIAGNLGLNIKFKASEEKPFKMFINDFDENGTHDIYLGYYDQDGKMYPVRGRQCSSEQMPFVKEKFESYEAFATATIDQVLEGRLEGSEERMAEMFASVILINQGDLNFEIKPLPNQAQISPIQDCLVRDVNGDSHLDIVTIGNYYNREVETTRSDAGVGCLLLGDGKGNFKAELPAKSGLNSYLDARSITEIQTATGPKILVANNDAPVDVYSLSVSSLQ